MKSYGILPVLIMAVIFFGAGCGKLGLTGGEKSADAKKNGRPPVALPAKMIDNIAAPAAAEIVSDKRDGDADFGKSREIELKTSSPVYDVAHFYRTEMLKNGWENTKRNEGAAEDEDSLHSFLRFVNEKEEVDIEIVSSGEKSSTVTIRVGENPEYSRKKRDAQSEIKREQRKDQRDAEREKIRNGFPMPSCADRSNTLKEPDALTFTGDCAENIETVSKFFKTEAPKSDWSLKDQNTSGAASGSVILVFTKGPQKALATLIKKTENSVSLSVRISK